MSWAKFVGLYYESMPSFSGFIVIGLFRISNRSLLNIRLIKIGLIIVNSCFKNEKSIKQFTIFNV